MSVTGGMDWGEAARALHKVGFAYPFIFCTYILFVQMAFFNVVASIFVENAMQIAANDAGSVIQDHMSSQSSWLGQMRRVFQEADEDNSQMLSWSAFETHLKDENVKALLAHLDLDISEAS